MRYFTKDLWAKINDCDEAIRAHAEKAWNEISITYQQEFAETMKHLSRTFVNNYLSRNGLHDYAILGIAITKRNRTYSCEIQLTDGVETVLIIMKGVKALKIDIDSFLHCVQGKLSWGYSEFELTPDNNVKLAVLCDMQNEMQFEFASIRITKQ